MGFTKYPTTGIATYGQYSELPVIAGDGDAAITLDTHNVYVYNKTIGIWQITTGSASVAVMASGPFDGASAKAAGCTVGSNNIYMQSATTVYPGLVSSGDQIFAGVKTFSGTIVSSVTGHASLDVLTSSLGTAVESQSSILTLASWSNATVGNPTILVKQCAASQSGYISSSDFMNFRMIKDAGDSGFPPSEADKFIVDYDYTARTCTINTNGVSGYFYNQGKRIDLTIASASPTFALNSTGSGLSHANTTGNFYYYFDNTGTFYCSALNSFFDLSTQTPVWAVYYNSVIPGALQTQEKHGMMPYQDHFEFHSTVGAYRLGSGGSPTFTSTATTPSTSINDVQPSISAVTMYDEDISHVLGADVSSTYTCLYRNGVNTWAWLNHATPFPNNGTNPMYNPIGSGSSYSLTAITANGQWFNVYIVGRGCLSSADGKRFLYIPQQAAPYSTLALARAESFFNLDTTGFPMAEYVPLAKMTFRRQDTGGTANAATAYRTNWESTQVITGVTSAQISGASPSIHSNLSGLQGGSSPDYYHLSVEEYAKVQTMNGSNTQDVRLNSIGMSPTGNGLRLTGQILNLEPASSIYGGCVSTATQNIQGIKIFNTEIRSENYTIGSVLVTQSASGAAYHLTLPTVVGSTGMALTGSDGTGGLQWSPVISNPMTAAGDILVGSGTANIVATRLAKGADNTYLVTDSSTSLGIVWKNKPSFKVYGETVAAVISDELQYLNPDYELLVDPNSLCTIGTATGSAWKFTFPANGIYKFDIENFLGSRVFGYNARITTTVTNKTTNYYDQYIYLLSYTGSSSGVSEYSCTLYISGSQGHYANIANQTNTTSSVTLTYSRIAIEPFMLI